MSSVFDAYILTNGRSSFKYCLDSLEQQTVPIKIHVIKNMSMLDAMNSIIKDSNVSRYFIKVDDDFIFHPRAIEYLQDHVPFNDGIAMKYWHLFDVSMRKKIESVKIYDSKRARHVGGFRARSSGRVDPPFLEDVRKAGLKCVKDPSMIALHACAPSKEQLLYEKIWASNAPARVHVKHNRKEMLNCNKSLDDQFDNRIEWIEASNPRKNSFSNFLRNSNL